MHKPFSKPIRRGFKDVLFIRLFRLWAQAREEGVHPILALRSEVEHQGFASFTGAACGCLFDLLEAQLGRSLVPASIADPHYSEDELRLLRTLKMEPTSNPSDCNDILSDSIHWAVNAVRSGMDFETAKLKVHAPCAEKPSATIG
ncbi:MAG: hypothetical protein AAF127_14795 [Pseudomonadota bacterium]